MAFMAGLTWALLDRLRVEPRVGAPDRLRPDDGGGSASRAPSPPWWRSWRSSRGCSCDVVEIPGQLTAEMTVVIKPEIEGIIQTIEFAEGMPVEKGHGSCCG